MNAKRKGIINDAVDTILKNVCDAIVSIVSILLNCATSKVGRACAV